MRTLLHQHALSSNERVVLLAKLSALNLLLDAAIKHLSQREKEYDPEVLEAVLLALSDALDSALNMERAP